MKKSLLILSLIAAGIALAHGAIRKEARGKLPQEQNAELSGDIAFQHYDIETASRHWEDAIRENPDNLSAYNKLGISLMMAKDYNGAIDTFREGLKRETDSRALTYNLALAYYYSGDFQKSITFAEKVLTLNSLYPGANYLKGLCLEKMGMEEEAQKAYVEELNTDPGSRAAWKKVKGGNTVGAHPE